MLDCWQFEDWLSIEAWLYKDSITRELRYSESQILNLLNDLRRQSSKQWLETLTSLTAEEHSGIDEAIDARKPNDTRKLLSVRIHSTRGASMFRLFLRLCSLGLLDSNQAETRSLLIIIGNKDSLPLGSSLNRYRNSLPSISDIDPLEPPPPPRPRMNQRNQDFPVTALETDGRPVRPPHSRRTNLADNDSGLDMVDLLPATVAVNAPQVGPTRKGVKAKTTQTPARMAPDYPAPAHIASPPVMPIPPIRRITSIIAEPRYLVQPEKGIEENRNRKNPASHLTSYEKSEVENAAEAEKRAKAEKRVEAIKRAEAKRRAEAEMMAGLARKAEAEKGAKAKERAETGKKEGFVAAASAAVPAQMAAEQMEKEAGKSKRDEQAVSYAQVEAGEKEKELIEARRAKHRPSIQEPGIPRGRSQPFHAGLQPVPVSYTPFNPHPHSAYYGYPPLPYSSYGPEAVFAPLEHLTPVSPSAFPRPQAPGSIYQDSGDYREFSPAVAYSAQFQSDQGQSTKKKGQKRTQQKKAENHAQEEQNAPQLRLHRRVSADSIMSVESTFDGGVAEGSLDEARIQELFAKWTPNGDQTNDPGTEVHISNSPKQRLGKESDVIEADNTDSKQRLGSDDPKEESEPLARDIPGRTNSDKALAEKKIETSEERVESSMFDETGFTTTSYTDKLDDLKSQEARKMDQAQISEGVVLRPRIMTPWNWEEKGESSNTERQDDDGSLEK